MAGTPPPKPPRRDSSQTVTLAGMIEGQREPAPPAGAFTEQERPTRPTNIHTRCAVLVGNFKDLQPEEMLWVEDVIELMLWARRKD